MAASWIALLLPRISDVVMLVIIDSALAHSGLHHQCEEFLHRASGAAGFYAERIFRPGCRAQRAGQQTTAVQPQARRQAAVKHRPRAVRATIRRAELVAVSDPPVASGRTWPSVMAKGVTVIVYCAGWSILRRRHRQ